MPQRSTGPAAVTTHLFGEMRPTNATRVVMERL
jgi:hypothetical protein